MKNNKLKQKANGFTILLSLLVISIILSVGLGVFDVMTKELKLSGIGRESQISFYAADAGIECAYFWDIKHPGLKDSAFSSEASFVSDNNIFCGGVSDNFSRSYDESEKAFYFNFDMGKDTTQKCAKVTVAKVTSENAEEKKTTTTIESKGYNYSCGSKSPHKVERAIRVTSTKTEKAE